MPGPTTPRIRVRIVLLIVLSIVFLASCIEAGRRYVLPGLLEGRILAALAEQGLADATVTLSHVTLRSASIENLTLDPEHRFSIDRVHVRYSLASLRHGQVHSIVIRGADAEVRIQDGAIDIGPLATLAGKDSTGARGPLVLPFDRIELDAARVHLRLPHRDIIVPVSAVLQRLTDSLVIDVRASLGSADVRIDGSTQLNGDRTALHLNVGGLEATFLRDVIGAFVSLDSVTVAGQIRVEGRAVMEDQNWQIQAAVEDDGFSLRSSFPAQPLEVVMESLDGDLLYSSSGGVSWDVRTRINHAPITVRGNLDVVKLDGQCDISLPELSAETLRQLISPIAESQLIFDGYASLTAHVDSRAGVLQATANADCRELVTTLEVDGHPLRIEGAVLGVTMTAAFDGERLTRLNGKATVQHVRLTSEHLKLSVPAVNCELPFSVDARTVEGGTFSAELLRVQGNDVTAIKGQISVREKSAEFSVTAFVLPEAESRVTGTLDLTASPPAGEIDVVIPRFTLKSGKELMERFPELNAGDVGGDFSVAAHFEYGDELVQRVDIDIKDGYFEPSNAEGRVDSVFGAVTLRSLEPPVTAGLQSLVFGSAVFGSFSGSNGDATFELREDQTVFVQSIRCDWLDGRIRSDSILVRPLESSLSCNVLVDSLSLQGILDFIDYDGVTGEGRIFGNLPVALSWGVGTTVSFGSGVLEARPRSGRLRLSKETAMTILGLTVELDPRTASREDMAKALTLKALQDMQYSTLRVTFQRAGEDDLLTRVQIKGHGPVGDPDNYVPIGGIDINISNLDDLLNNIILPALETKKVNLGS